MARPPARQPFPFLRNDRARRALGIVGGAAAFLAGLGLANTLAARRAETVHRPQGRLFDVDGVRVHALDSEQITGKSPTSRDEQGGDEAPVVLLHGNLVTAGDWLNSGVFDRLVASGRRVIAFDRPGFGHSERPADRHWGPREQAALLRAACRLLDVRRPLVVGHSWSTLVALAWGLDAPDTTHGIVLLGGYYYPTTRIDAVVVAPAAAPVIGPVLRRTVAPPFARVTLQPTLKGMFSPRAVPEDYVQDVPPGLIARPSQIRAVAEEGTMMVREATRLSKRIDRLRVPVGIMAGRADEVVDPAAQSVRLAADLARKPERMVELAIEPDAGHMVHHAAPARVASMIALVSAARNEAVGADRGTTPAGSRI